MNMKKIIIMSIISVVSFLSFNGFVEAACYNTIPKTYEGADGAKQSLETIQNKAKEDRDYTERRLLECYEKIEKDCGLQEFYSMDKEHREAYNEGGKVARWWTVTFGFDACYNINKEILDGNVEIDNDNRTEEEKREEVTDDITEEISVVLDSNDSDEEKKMAIKEILSSKGITDEVVINEVMKLVDDRGLSLTEAIAQIEERLNNYFIDVSADCSLITDSGDLDDFIIQIFNYIRIIAVILLVVLGALDFAKVIVSGDNDALKKTINTFIKRAIFTVAIFMLPVILRLVFGLFPDLFGDNVDNPLCDIL